MFSGKLSDYEILRFMGGGSYGNVYEAFDVPNQRIVVLKALSIADACEEFAVYQEIFSSGLKFPHVVKCHGLFVGEELPLDEAWIQNNKKVYDDMIEFENKRVKGKGFLRNTYLVFDFGGTDLWTYLKCNRLEEKDIKKYIQDIGTCVQKLHQLGILYSDFSTKNILVSINLTISDENASNLEFKLCDFGFACRPKRVNDTPTPSIQKYALPFLDPGKNTVQLTLQKRIFEPGNPFVCAPETLKCAKKLKGKTFQDWTKMDVWSLTLIVFPRVLDYAVFWTIYSIKKDFPFKKIKGIVKDFGPKGMEDLIGSEEMNVLRKLSKKGEYFMEILGKMSQEMLDLSIKTCTEKDSFLRKYLQKSLVLDFEKRATLEEILDLEHMRN